MKTSIMVDEENKWYTKNINKKDENSNLMRRSRAVFLSEAPGNRTEKATDSEQMDFSAFWTLKTKSSRC